MSLRLLRWALRRPFSPCVVIADHGRMPKGYRRKLDAILARDPKGRNSGLTLLALKAFPSSPLQKLLQNLRALD